MLEPRVTLSTQALHALGTGRTIIPVSDAIFKVQGHGAIACLQGLFTNDLAKLDDGACAWGAFLTPKGMIVSDAWVMRGGDVVFVAVPRAAEATVRQLFSRTMPPRLATVTELPEAVRPYWLIGESLHDQFGVRVWQPRDQAPFHAFALSKENFTALPEITSHWTIATEAYADVLRVLGGWPALGREIDERTLVQEARFDELGGVRYDKGCFTGQETVSRLHFRGHANRLLRGVCWAPGEHPTEISVSDGEKEVGTIRTLVRAGDKSFALAVLRREVSVGDTVRTGSSEGVVIEPPFDLGESVEG